VLIASLDSFRKQAQSCAMAAVFAKSARGLRILTLVTSLVLPCAGIAVAPPTFEPDGSRATAPINVTIRGAKSGAAIHFTVDGSEPTVRDTEIESDSTVVIDHPLVLKAKVWLPDGTVSESGSADYALEPVRGVGATFVEQEVPSSMVVGGSYPITVAMRNIGTDEWAPGDYFLAAQKERDAQRWSVLPVQLREKVTTWGIAAFVFTVTAPRDPGTYNFQWRVLTHAGQIGEPTELVRVAVLSSEEFEKQRGLAAGTNVQSEARNDPLSHVVEKGRGSNGNPTPQSVHKPITGNPTAGTTNARRNETEFDRLVQELRRSPRSFKYLRTIGFNHTDAEFEKIVAKHEDIFSRTRIIRRDEQGNRIIPGWSGVRLKAGSTGR
jgi:hypothetical protein